MSRITSLQNSLIVSCQALPNEPLHSPTIMSKMALASYLGGAKGIRANSVIDILEIKKEVNLPIIGIIKEEYNNSDVFITPTLKEVEKLVDINVEIIALDATRRRRPNGYNSEDFLKKIKSTYPDIIIMGDCADLEDIKLAEKYCDFIGTTLYGYTDYTKNCDISDNDFDYLKKIINYSSRPVIAEGKIDTPEKAKKCLKYGAWSIVVGTAITRPMEITKKFVNKINY